MTTPLTAALAEKGVEVLLGQTAEAITPTTDGITVKLTSG